MLAVLNAAILVCNYSLSSQYVTSSHGDRGKYVVLKALRYDGVQFLLGGTVLPSDHLENRAGIDRYENHL